MIIKQVSELDFYLDYYDHVDVYSLSLSTVKITVNNVNDIMDWATENDILIYIERYRRNYEDTSLNISCLEDIGVKLCFLDKADAALFKLVWM